MFDIHIGIKGQLKMTLFILLECLHLSISWALHLTARSSRNMTSNDLQNIISMTSLLLQM